MTFKPNFSRSFNVALIFSILGYAMFLGTTGNYFVKTGMTRFDLITSDIEHNKQKLIMLSLFTESELDRLSKFSIQGVNEGIHPRFNDAIYSHNNAELTLEETIVRSVMHRSISHLPNLINSPNSLLLYRSFEGEKYILQRQVNGFQVTPELFTAEHCYVNHACSKYAWADQLQDRVIISDFYTDSITGRKVLSIVAPVTRHSADDLPIFTEDIIGEYILDIYLDMPGISGGIAPWLADKEIKIDYVGRRKHIEIFYEGYWLNDLAFRRTYVVDNMTVFSYNYPVSKLLGEHLIYFLLMFLASYLLHLKFMESKERKTQLVSAISNANVDELTGLYNRKLFKSSVFKRSVSEKGCAVVAIDGNSIKAINDNYGHHVGDMAIKQIGTTMQRVFRSTDYLIRNGGDEFLAILPSCSINRAQQLAETLQKAVMKQVISEHKLTITIATGVAYRELHEPFEIAVIRADEKLYEQKKLLKQPKANLTNDLDAGF